MRFMRQVSGIIKTSAVLISTRDDEGFYNSIHDVPLFLRTRLEEATNGSNSGTILIADKGGRERILARAAGMAKEPELTPLPETPVPPQWTVWAGALLLILATVIIVLVWGKWPKG
ncbi:MAG: hypothetical protein JWN34_4842 [Bryobacterales bacterium]|jgi:hypothetical protein|nr:hypothetical protein [Bryobacterales bacterium]